MQIPTKTEEIKVRVEPKKKLLLQQIADEEGLDLSDIARRAFNELIKRNMSANLREAA